MVQMMFRPVLKLGIHAMLGMLMFLVMAVPAVALGALGEVLGGLHLPWFTLAVLTFVERSILVADALLFMAHLLRSLVRAFREMDVDEE